METICVGVAGCGRITERCHLPALLGFEGVSIRAVADPKPERRRLIATRAGNCQRFPSAREMLAAGGLDALIVASPPETHTAVALAAIGAGIPVLIEKPLAASLEDAENFAVAVAGMEERVVMGFNRRWWAPLLELRASLASDYSRADLSIDMVQVSDSRAWDACAPAASLLDDLACHQLDLLRFLTGGEVQSLEARATDDGGVLARVEMTRGRARVEASCYVAYGRPSVERIEVQAGTERFLAHHSSDRLRRGEARLAYGRELLDAIGRRVARRPSAMTRSFELQLRHFCDVVRGKARPSPGLADGLAAVRMVERVRQRLAASPEKIERSE